jgi:hypothetical protein
LGLDPLKGIQILDYGVLGGKLWKSRFQLYRAKDCTIGITHNSIENYEQLTCKLEKTDETLFRAGIEEALNRQDGWRVQEFVILRQPHSYINDKVGEIGLRTESEYTTFLFKRKRDIKKIGK